MCLSSTLKARKVTRLYLGGKAGTSILGLCLFNELQPQKLDTQRRNPNRMAKSDPQKPAFDDEYDDEDLDEEEYDDMELLERLETVREDMEDLGVTTLAEVIQRIQELHRKLDKR